MKELNISAGVYMRDFKFTTDSGIVNLHPSVGTHFMFTNQNYFDSYVCPPPVNILSRIVKVFIQNIKSRKMIVIVQRIYTFCVLHT